MARNRKSNATAIRFGQALKAFLLCAVIVSACLGYVWFKKQIGELAEQKRRKENRLVELRKQNEKLKWQLGELQSLRSLEKKVTELKLGLVAPQPGQLWRLPEPLADKSALPEEKQYAAERAESTPTP